MEELAPDIDWYWFTRYCYWFTCTIPECLRDEYLTRDKLLYKFTVTLLLLLLLLLLHPFNGLFSRTTWVSQYQKGKTSLDLDEARDVGVLGYCFISWTICKQSVSHYRQITTLTPHHSVFTGQMFFLTPNQQCQSTEGNLLSLYCTVPGVHPLSCQSESPGAAPTRPVYVLALLWEDQYTCCTCFVIMYCWF